MSIKHTAVSYYGFNYVEHAREDFKEMIEHGCDTVILAITEFDMDFWFPNINEIVKTAPLTMTFWQEWHTATIEGINYTKGDKITVGIYVKCSGAGSGAWGKIDDAMLNLVKGA